MKRKPEAPRRSRPAAARGSQPDVGAKLATAATRAALEPPLISFTSDFGHEDWFVGVVHGGLLEICPRARVVDVTHAIPPGLIERAAFVLEAACPDLPPG